MARTKAEVRAYLESCIGQSIDASCGEYRGQCVSLIKGLLNFLGAPNPYAARGNAKDAGDIYLQQGIARPGDGWLRVCVNRDMGLIDGVRYGHIWIDLRDEVNYEQNGYRALRTTKNTRPISQAQQIVNLDQYITSDSSTGTGGGTMAGSGNIESTDVDLIRIISSEVKGWDFNAVHSGVYDQQELKAWVGQSIRKYITDGWKESEGWRNTRNAQMANYPALQAQVVQLNSTVADLNLQLTGKQAEIADLQDDNAKLKAENEELKKALDKANQPKPPTPVTDTPEVIKGDFLSSFISFIKSLFKK